MVWISKVVRQSSETSSDHERTPVRWADVNKGDEHSCNVRCRLVGKELRAKTKEVLLAHELFSVITRWKTVTTL